LWGRSSIHYLSRQVVAILDMLVAYLFESQGVVNSIYLFIYLFIAFNWNNDADQIHIYSFLYNLIDKLIQ